MPRRLRQLLKPALLRAVPMRYVVWHGCGGMKRIALTFDDGPHPRFTPRIAAALREAGALATFFVVGAHVEKQKDLLAELVAAGHEVGNHTHSHAHLGRAGCRRGIEELVRTDRLLRRLDPRYTGIFRPPWGQLGLAGALYAVRYGRRAVMWTLDSRDHLLDGVRPLQERLEASALSGGSILLFHDDNEFTADALPGIIDSLRRRGFQFTTVSQLLKRFPAQECAHTPGR